MALESGVWLILRSLISMALYSPGPHQCGSSESPPEAKVLLTSLPCCLPVNYVGKGFDMYQGSVNRLEKAFWLLCSFLPRLLDLSSYFPLLKLFWVSGLQGLSPRLLHMAAVLDPTEDSAWVSAPWAYTSEHPGMIVRSALEVSYQFVSNSPDYQQGAVLFQHWSLDTLLCPAGSMGQRHWQSPMYFDLYVSFLFATLIPFPLQFLGINYKGMLASEEHFWGHLIWRHVFKLLVNSIMCFVAGELQWVDNSSYTFCSLSFAYIKYYFYFHTSFNF